MVFISLTMTMSHTPLLPFKSSPTHHPLSALFALHPRHFPTPASPEKMEVEDLPKMSGCGLFRRRRRTNSSGTIPPIAADTGTKLQDSGAGRRRTGSDETSIVPVIAPGPPVVKSRAPVATPHGTGPSRPPPEPVKELPPPKSGNGIVAELDSVLYNRQRAKGGSHLVRASSSNVMVYGNLGNLRGNSNFKNLPSRNVLEYLPKTAKELSMEAKEKNDHGGLSTTPTTTNRGMGNIMRSSSKETAVTAPVEAPELCRALSRRLDPEELKEMGNEEYKMGRFAEALALYDRAIVMDPGKACYYSNKAAALTGMGRLLEAVGECKEAIRIDPAYYRAHHRLATLYLRLGEAEKAIHHFKLSRNEASPNDTSRAQAVRCHITKSNETRKLKDYLTLLKESQLAASSGADSAPQVLALQAEALLKLHRHDEADSILSGTPKFGIDESTKFFGAVGNAYFLMVEAQVDMAAGRFEDAVAAAQKSAQIDPSNREIGVVLRRIRAVASARSRGNDLFRASKFAEACVAYGEGLNHDSHNAVLLCNRAACRSKLGHYEKAIEDCNTALIVCPSYTKARLRRAGCNAKLERWEASAKDYKVLIQEIPGDEEVSRALSEAQAKLKKLQGEHVEDTNSVLMF